jgi:hypothetical protein
MPQYVILEHDHPFPHWDLMLEAGAVLRTWRLLALPGVGATVLAEALADHRRDYLDYEGPVSGDRGRVVRWDSGNYQVERDTGEELLISLNGTRLRGTGQLRKKGDGEWEFFVRDAAGENNGSMQS